MSSYVVVMGGIDICTCGSLLTIFVIFIIIKDSCYCGICLLCNFICYVLHICRHIHKYKCRCIHKYEREKKVYKDVDSYPHPNLFNTLICLFL